jgi:2-dehydro-3-deoxy-D-arabinonate dehydratase
MYLTRHQTVKGPRWALDGRYLPSRFRLGLILELFANLVPVDLERSSVAEVAEDPLLPPLDLQHEVWTSDGLYSEPSEARRARSITGTAYHKVSEAERPMLFLKAVGWRTVGHSQPVRTRGDSQSSFPQPALVLVLNQHLEIVGYTAGNDVFSRDIENENPLYLPQAKMYDDSCAVGPGIVISDADSLRDISIEILIEREGVTIYEASTRTSQMARQPAQLAAYLGRELDFPDGVFLMVGSGLVPPEDLVLRSSDKIRTTVGELVLENEVASPESGSRFSGWSSPYNGHRYRTIRHA